MKNLFKKVENIHKKKPYIEVIFTFVLGAFFDRHYNTFLDELSKSSWHLNFSFYFMVLDFIILFLYYKYFSSVRLKCFSPSIEKKKEKLDEALYEEGIKEIRKIELTIQEKSEIHQLVKDTIERK